MKSISFGFFLAALLLVPSIAMAQTATDVVCTGCVGTTDIANSAVTSGKLGNNAVTTAKLGNNAVTTAKIADGTIVNADISDTAAIAASKIADGAASTLDADYFDGLDSSQFLRSDQSGSVTGNLTLTGSIGIGTTSPVNSLDVVSTGNTKVLIHANDATNDRNPELELKAGNTDAGGHSIIRFSKTGGTVSESLEFQNESGTVVLALTGAGYVGIGTTSPSSLLDISGETTQGSLMVKSEIDSGAVVRLERYGSDGSYFHIETGAANNDTLAFHRGSSPYADLVIGSNGYIGVGTQTPSKPLTIDAGDNDALYLLSNSSDDWYVGPNVAAAGFGIYDATQGASRLHITTSGNVGIGTTSPNYPLDVNGIAQAQAFEARSSGTPYVDFSNDTTSDYDARFILVSDDVLALQGTTDFSMDANVGIGTNYSDAELHVNDPSAGAVVKVSGNNGTYGLYMGADSNGPWIGSYTDDILRLVTNSTERMRITEDGRVGIGTSSPTSTLDIEGDLSINDEIAYPDPSLSDHSDSSTQGTIQYYIDQGYGHIHLQPGDYSIDDQLTLTSNLTIEGSGWDSKIVMSSSSTADGIAKDGSGTGIDNVVLKDFFIEGEPSERTNCIYIGGSDSDRNTSIRIEGLKVQNCGEHGIHVKGTNQLIISNIVVSNCGTDTEEDHNIYLRRIDNGTISDVISKEAAANGFNGYDLDGVSITNFIARDNGFRGIRVSGSSRVTISNSQAIDNGEIGFMIQEELDEDDGTTHYSYNVTLSGCVAYGNDGSGVRLGSAGGYYVVTGCVIKNNGAYGVQLYSSPSDVIIDATVFDNNSSGSYTGTTSSTIIGDIST